jgi:hypothetical protein
MTHRTALLWVPKCVLNARTSVILSVAYLLIRCLRGCLLMFTRRQVSKEAEFLVFRNENAVLRRQISRVRYQPRGPGRLSTAAAIRKLVIHIATDNPA